MLLTKYVKGINCSLSISSSLSSSSSFECLCDWWHCSAGSAMDAYERLETSFDIFFYFALVVSAHVALYIYLDVLFNNLNEMLLLIAAVEDKHVIRSDCSIATKLAFEEAENVLWIAAHCFCLLSEVDPWWLGGSPGASRFDQFEGSFCWRLQYLVRDSLKHEFIVKWLVARDIY